MSDYEEQWKLEQVAEATEVVATLDRLRQLPASREEARKLLAIEGVVEASQLAQQMSPMELTSQQLLAAILRGRGLKHTEVAEVMELKGGSAIVHEWETTIPAFRRTVAYWLEVSEDDQRAMALREMEEIAATVEDPKVRIQLVRLRMLLGDKPETRAWKRKEMEFREREVAAKERESDGGQPLKPPVKIIDLREADFTATDEEPADESNLGQL